MAQLQVLVLTMWAFASASVVVVQRQMIVTMGNLPHMHIHHCLTNGKAAGLLMYMQPQQCSLHQA